MSAYLAFPFKSHKIRIISIGRGYNLQLNAAMTRKVKHYYPVRLKEQDLQFTVQCHSEAEYDALRSTIVKAQNNVLSDPNTGIARLVWPEYKLDYLGFIPTTTGGVRRFDHAPTLPISMIMIKDSINTLTTIYSTLQGRWQDIFGANIVDVYNSGKNEDDSSGNYPEPRLERENFNIYDEPRVEWNRQQEEGRPGPHSENSNGGGNNTRYPPPKGTSGGGTF